MSDFNYLLSMHLQDAAAARHREKLLADELAALKKHRTTDGFREYKDGDITWITETHDGFWRVAPDKAVRFDLPMVVEVECKANVQPSHVKWVRTGNYRVIGPAPVPEPVKRSWWRRALRVFRRIEPIPTARLLQKGNP